MLFTSIKNVWLFERLSYNYKPQSMNVINYKNTLKCIVYGTIMDRKLSINFARSCMNGMFSVTQALVWKKHQLNCLHNWLDFFLTQKGTFMLYKCKWFFVSYFLWISENGKRFLFQGKNKIYFGIIIVHVGPMFMAFYG